MFRRSTLMPLSGSTSCGREIIGNASKDDVFRSVASVVASGILGKGERRERLLRYLVEMELDGCGKELKAYSIALDVFDRDDSFDPNTDSIVRSEVGRLRDALRIYNVEIAEPNQPRILIPKGTYRPTISFENSDAVGRF